MADHMGEGESFHRVGIGIDSFAADGKPCLAASYLDEVGPKYRYRYVVLCGGEPALRALRRMHATSADEGEDLLRPQFRLAGYEEYQDFTYRLPKYLGDLVRRYEDAIERADESPADESRLGRLESGRTHDQRCCHVSYVVGLASR